MRELVGHTLSQLSIKDVITHKTEHHSRLFAKLSLVVLLLYAVSRMLKYLYYTLQTTGPFTFVPFQADFKDQDVVVVDATHATCPTITHHKAGSNPRGLRPADTSTAMVLSALQNLSLFGGDVHQVCQTPHVSTNHFDVDSFLSVWCYINRKLALQHEAVLKHAARIGDFREAFLSPELVATYGAVDGITSIRDAYTALKLCCWLNTVEKALFTAPYQAQDCARKMAYFLPRFEAVLQDPEAHWQDWQAEYTQVVSAYDALQNPGSSVSVHPEVGLAVVTTPEPLHYYSIFSHTIDCDVVLCIYDGNRYEVECKYTQYISLPSRPVWPRLDMGPLAQALNELEEGLDGSLKWGVSRITDTAPLLRLDRSGKPLSKAERYGHPTQRPIHASTIAPLEMAAIVRSFFEYGLRAHRLRPKAGGWSWQELHTINKVLSWGPWLDTCRRQLLEGELKSPAHLPTEGTRRMSNDLLDAVPDTNPHQPSPLQDPSTILSPLDAAIIQGTLPSFHRLAKWRLLYSTAVHGISLKTLFRNAANAHPTVLVVKDTGGAVFGAFAPDPWRVHPRFYGTGETYVFSLHPTTAAYPWLPPAPGQERNDFFLFAELEQIAVGGAGHWAIRLDGDLLSGSSGECHTFGSPCLASGEEFKVHTVELWSLA